MEDDQSEGGAVAGWPLGLPPVTLQMRLANAFSSALHPHSTFLLATPTCSSLGSSDLDTESSLFSFQARSITLGSLMGMRSGSEPSLMRARSLAVASNCSQVSSLHPHHHHYHQSCQVLELCRKLVRRRHFKCIAVDSAKLWSSFLIRCGACIQAEHKQSNYGGGPHLQPMDGDIIAVPSLAHLLQADRAISLNNMVPTQALEHTVMYDGAANVDNPVHNPLFEAPPTYGGKKQCDMNEAGVGNSRVKSNFRKGACLKMESIKKRVKRKYWEPGGSFQKPM